MTARAHIPIQRRVVRPEYLSDYTIVEYRPGDFRVYQSSAWTAPTETPMLPWHPPTGTPVAVVGLDGSVTMLDSSTVPPVT